MYKLSLILILLIAFSAAKATDENFSIVLFPDTQNMVSSHHDMWETMPQWVVENKEDLNIKAVIGLGDVTNSGSKPEYIEAITGNMSNNRGGWNLIKSSGLIYMPTRGNNGDSNEALWNEYFGPEYFTEEGSVPPKNMSWFGGCYDSSTSCYYVKFAEGSQKYLVMAVGHAPTKLQKVWANQVLKKNSDSKVIVVAHSYLENDTLTKPEGEDLWNDLIMNNKNIFLVVCGHMHVGIPPTSYGTREKVNELRADYQDIQDGDGYMMILTFQPSKGKIQTRAYSNFTKMNDTNGSYGMDICVLPTPRLVYIGKEDRITGGITYTYYNLAVANRNYYPAYLFAPAPDLGLNGLNNNPSRTWVDIYDNQTGKSIRRFSALSKPSDMGGLWFAIAKGKVPPKSVYITLHDRKCDIKSKSNPVNIK